MDTSSTSCPCLGPMHDPGCYLSPKWGDARIDAPLIASEPALLRIAAAAERIADALLARRAPLGDQPAAYVPKVGDVVKWADGAFPGVEIILESINGIGSINGYEVGRGTESGFGWPDASYVKYVRPATPAERVAAGLDQPAASNDEGCEVCACRDEDCANPKHAHHPTHQPAASETPADPRRTVGAVVRYGGNLFVVCAAGDGARRQRGIDADPHEQLYGCAYEGDVFERWATRAECERHRIPYVERDAKPASPARSERLARCPICNSPYPLVHNNACENPWHYPTPAPRDEAKGIDGRYTEAIRVAELMLDPENQPPQYGMNEGWRMFSDALARARDGGR